LTVIFRGIDAKLGDVACGSSGCPSFNLVQRYEPNVRRSILSHSLGAEEQSPASQVTKSSDGRCGSKHNCPPPGVQKVTVELPRARHPLLSGLTQCISNSTVNP